MSQPLDQYHSALNKAGLSNTKPRKAVFEALLSQEHQPITMNELVKQCAHICDRASVYRSVNTLEEAGIIHRLQIGWKYKLELSEQFHGHHHHITCINCGNTHSTHDDETFEQVLSELAARNGYTITDHQLDIKGICSHCQKNRTRL